MSSTSQEQPKQSSKVGARLLRSHYPVVTTLGGYLKLDEQTDRQGILNQILLGLLASQPNSVEDNRSSVDSKTRADGSDRVSLSKIGEVEVSMSQIIEAAQSILLWRSGSSLSCKSNVLILGCRLSNEAYPELAISTMNGPFGNSLVSKFVAYDMTINTFLTRSHFFAELLRRIGPKRMLHLLTDTAMYYPAGNGCYFQITGQPILELPILPPKGKPQVKRISLADITLEKSSLMYTPVGPRQSAAVRMGFPPEHVLSQLHGSEASFKSDHFRAVHLSKYIFPSEFGLNSFSSSTHTEATQRLKKLKTPQRVKRLIQPDGFLHKIVMKSKTAKLQATLNRCCRSKFLDCHITTEERLSLMELTEPSQDHSSELSGCPASSDSRTTRSLCFAGSTQLHNPPKPKFSRFVCSPHEVENFTWAMIQDYGLSHWWGHDSKHNERIVRNNIYRIINLRRFERISLHELIQGLRLKECDPWISRNPPDYQSHKMLQDFQWWFYFSFIGGLIKNTFFVTESTIFRNRTLYFRLDDWEKICAPLVNYLTHNLFTKVDQQTIKDTELQLGHSFLRLLPKDSGFRPIVNLKRKWSSNRGLSNNSVLQNLFSVLTYEKSLSPDKIGSSVLSVNHVYTRFKAFKSSFGSSIPKLYFVKVDIRTCFDSIQQKKILEVINKIFSEDQYAIRKYGKTSSAKARLQQISKQFKRQAYPSDEVPHFDEFVAKVSKALKNVLFNDQVKYTYIDRDDLLNLLKEHITQNFVKIGSHIYKQKNGIPQGSILSPILCSLFYGDMDKQRLAFTKKSDSLLVRFIDDFIYVTTSQHDAERFLKVMAEGIEEYGCYVSMEKALINFKFGQVNQIVGHEFPWCGSLINTKTLEFKLDLSRQTVIHVGDTLTVDRARTPGLLFYQRMFHITRIRMHILYLDCKLNSISTVLLNVYQAFTLVAAKYVAYIKDWGADTVKGWKFFHGVIEKIIAIAFAYCRKQAEQEFVKEVHGNFKIKLKEMVWLGRQAFKQVLSRKAQRFILIIQQIEVDLRRQNSRSVNRNDQSRLKSILTSKANLLLRSLKF